MQDNTMKKFKLTDKKKKRLGVDLYRIESLMDFSDVRKGDVGGWIEKEENLSQDGNAWVYDNAVVCGAARVTDDAIAYCEAEILGKAVICDKAAVGDSAVISGGAVISGSAQVGGDAQIRGKAKIRDIIVINGLLYN